jgi:elongation factor G
MDRIGADFDNTIRMMIDRLGARPLVTQIPWGAEEKFRGVVDLIRMKAHEWDDESLGARMAEIDIPAEMTEAAQDARIRLVEAAAETDDAIMEAYLNEEDISVDRLSAAIRQATIDLKGVPVFCGAALRNRGVQLLLDGIVQFLPSPLDVPPAVGRKPGSEDKVELFPKEKAPLGAICFKVVMDQGRKLAYVRMYSGRLAVGQDVYNSRTGQKEKIARILRMHSNKRERIEEALAGDLVAVIGLKSVTTGDTLCDSDHAVVLERIEEYEPVINVAVEPKVSSDLEKVDVALGRLAEEDPTFRYRVDEDTGQTIISGMGELHLDVLVHRLGREFGVALNVGKPQVVFRESIAREALVVGRFDRELGGTPRFAEVTLRLKPLKRGEGFRYVNRLSEEDLPPLFTSAIEKAVQEGSQSGAILGYPVLDVLVVLEAATQREGVSTEPDFRVAASQAFREGLQSGGPIILEPMMAVEVIVPDEFTGEVIGDLGSRQGKVENITGRKMVKVVSGLVPLSEMFGYSTALRSATQGRGTFTMQFSHYDVVDRKK